jgi:hypothetical protein
MHLVYPPKPVRLLTIMDNPTPTVKIDDRTFVVPSSAVPVVVYPLPVDEEARRVSSHRLVDSSHADAAVRHLMIRLETSADARLEINLSDRSMLF